MGTSETEVRFYIDYFISLGGDKNKKKRFNWKYIWEIKGIRNDIRKR